MSDPSPLTFVITFGQRYCHEEHPACSAISGDSFLRINAADELEAREKVVTSRIGYAWAFMYEWDEFEPQIERHGLHDVTAEVPEFP